MDDEITIQPDLDSMPAIAADDVGGEDPKLDEFFIKDSLGLKSGKYSKKNAQGLFRAAKYLGIDGPTLVALALQETALGKNAGRRGGLASAFDIDDNQLKELSDLSGKSGIDEKFLKPAIILRDKLAYAKRLGFTDEAAQLQAYNGYGTITPESFGGATKAYGVDISKGVNMKQNPLYGKRLVQLKNDLMANQYIQSLLK